MKKGFALMTALLLLAGNVFAAGDLIVDGKLGVGTTSPSDKVVIQLPGIMGYDLTTVSGLVLKAPDSQITPALTFIGGGPNGGDTGKIYYDSGNDIFNFSGGVISIPVGSQIIFGSFANNIGTPTGGNAVFHFNSSINLETKSDNTGKVIIPYGNVGIGTSAPAAKLQIANGDAYTSTAGNGLIVKSPDGLICRKIGIDNNGNILLSAVTCP